LKRGAHVTIVARTKSKLDIAVKELLALLPSDSKQKVISVSVDTGSSQEAVNKAFAPAIAEMGSVDVLVNCAGERTLTLRLFSHALLVVLLVLLQ
jgi:NAD(P)-dependent dehydrogenase (short-subunit alcohol dehydrogenase family)